LIVPLVAALLQRYSGRALALSPGMVAAAIAMTVLLPLAVGMLCRAVLPALADRIELPVSIVGGVLLRVAALALLATNLSAIWALIANGTIIAIAILVVAGLAAGHLLGGPDAEERSALALATASRHPGIAFAIASAGLAEERFGATILLYLLVGAVVGLPYTIWQRKKARDTEAAAAMLKARKKAVDDIQAGRPTPYYLAPAAAPAPSEAATPVSPSADRGHAAMKTDGKDGPDRAG
jgi:bile acid:Na+ symporter, BASS family